MAARLPALGDERSVARYLREIRQFPMLEEAEEFMLAKRWREHGDAEAAHRLVTSHLRLVAKIAMGYRGYGLPVSELISEGNVGLMQAVKRFDADRGFRLATYAMWWIRASIQEYVLHSWSLVKLGTTAAQKKLFFNLRKVKRQIQAIEDGDMSPEQVKHVSTALGVTETEVVEMNRRLAGPDRSLNAPVKDESGGEWQDWLVDPRDNQETSFLESEELVQRRQMLTDAMRVLTARERRVIEARQLAEEPATLETLSIEFGVSRERVRQIEARALQKLEKAVRSAAAVQRDGEQAARLSRVEARKDEAARS